MSGRHKLRAREEKRPPAAGGAHDLRLDKLAVDVTPERGTGSGVFATASVSAYNYSELGALPAQIDARAALPLSAAR